MKAETAVMKITVEERGKVRDLGYKVHAGISTHSSELGVAVPPIVDLETETNTLKDYIAEEDGSTASIAKSEAQCSIVFELLKTYLAWINNGPAKNIKSLLLLSGFDVSLEPVVHGIPNALVIKKMENGETPATVKVFIEAIPATDFVDRYKVETSPDDITFTIACETGNSSKLIIPGTVRGKEIFVRVSGGNTHGFGRPSTSVSFFPN